MRPDLVYLETFQSVVRERGFARAARRLGISQPAVSYRIRRLEDQLGAALFEVPRRRVILTPAGRALDDVCARFLSELEEVGARLATDTLAPAPLRVACAGAFGRNVVFPILRSDVFRGVPVEMSFRDIEEIFDLVERGACDLGIAYRTRVTNTLEFERVATEEFVLIGAVGTCPPDGADLGEVAARPFVTYEECDYVFGRWFDDVYGRQPRRLTSASRFSRLEEVVATVADGRGVSVVPEHAVRHGLGARTLQRFQPPGERRSLNPEYAVTRPGWTPTAEVVRLLTALRDAAGEPPAAG